MQHPFKNKICLRLCSSRGKDGILKRISFGKFNVEYFFFFGKFFPETKLSLRESGKNYRMSLQT